MNFIPKKLFDDFLFRAGKAILILFLAKIAHKLLKRFFQTAFAKIKKKRAKTLLSLTSSASSILIGTLALFFILQIFGVNIAPLLASAGIVGLAIGFGAQTLVKDLIAGIFLLIEAPFDQGDIIRVGKIEGKVEKISLRTITLKDKSGAIHTIPNGQITIVTNLTP